MLKTVLTSVRVLEPTASARSPDASSNNHRETTLAAWGNDAFAGFAICVYCLEYSTIFIDPAEDRCLLMVQRCNQ